MIHMTLGKLSTYLHIKTLRVEGKTYDHVIAISSTSNTNLTMVKIRKVITRVCEQQHYLKLREYILARTRNKKYCD
jgi:hypothetical protein